MSDPNSQGNPAGKSGARQLWGAVLLLAVAIGLFFLFRDRENGGAGGGGVDGGEKVTQERLELTRTALAATENLEIAEANDAWESLYEKNSEDSSLALNRSINRVLGVDQLAAQATNASLDDAEKKAARAKLPGAISAARTAIDDLASITDDVVTPMWLRVRVDLLEASLLPGSMTNSLRKEIYQRLSAAITGEAGQDPNAIILGGSLIAVVEQLEDPIDGLPDELLQNAAKTVGVLSSQHPDNIFFALRAARLNIASENEQAVEFIQRASQLASAIEPSVRRETAPIGVTPGELVSQITTAVGSGDWSEAENRMLLWFNVLNSTEIVKTDRRRASPHPLDRLSFDSLRRLSAKMVKANPMEQGSGDWEFKSVPIDASAEITSLLVIDYDLDLVPDLASVNADRILQLWRNDSAGNWEVAAAMELDIETRGMIAADLFVVDSSSPGRLRADRKPAPGSQPDYAATVRHNTFVNLVAFGEDGVRLIQVDGRTDVAADARMQLVEEETGLEDVSDVTAAVAGDLEADGDLDLVLATKSDGVRLFVNRGNRTFFEVVRSQNGFAKDDPVASMAIADLDRDLDLDIVTVHTASGRVGILENLLHLQFRERYFDEIIPIVGASHVAVEDVDGNVSWDLIVGGHGGSAVVFSQTADAGAWTVDRIETTEQAGLEFVTEDFDNDSWIDLISTGSGDAFVSRLGPWGVEPGRPAAALGGTADLVSADFDRNGTIDLAGVRDKKIQMITGGVGSPGHHIDVRFKGIDDNASGRVNHYAIGSVLELRFGPHYRARIVKSPSTHFGLDGFDAANSVRAILPNGLTQTIRNPIIDSLVEEEQTLKGSCPYLYSWDGEKFVFQTDCLWAAPLGLQVARGVVAKDRPWEYLKIDGRNIKPRGDRYDFRITEELWEVAYFDKVALTVVDHPASIEVWTNEKVGPAQIATPTIFAFEKENLRPIRNAFDKTKRNVTEKLARQDRDFVQGFDRRLRQGLCEPHWIDLDFGDLELNDSSDASIYLVLTGWILPTDTSLNIQIDQNPQLGPVEFPSVWVPGSSDSDGQAVWDGWREVIPFMGFPGGKTKTIVVDVTDVMNRSDPRFRVRTSAQIYWDAAQLAVQSAPAEYRTERVNLIAAEVGFHGFSMPLRDDFTHPETYDYQQASLSPRWPPLRGSLTRFGECSDLLRDWDDEMVVISSGDEIRLEFSLPESELPPGWERDFVFHSVGWDKDADLNTLSGQSTGPLPYREMTQYPPPVGAKADLLEKQNRAHLQRYQSFRSFWYRERDEPSRFLDASRVFP